MRFDLSYIEQFLDHLEPFELLLVHSKVADLAPTGLQIWGIPEGARDVLANMVRSFKLSSSPKGT